jgi:kynurenine formamidase
MSEATKAGAGSDRVPDISDVRALCGKVKNWGRWGPDDEKGTLNYVRPEHVARGAQTVQLGEVISLAVPFNEHGPQTGGFARFNPIHLMTRDGNDALANTTPRDFYGGKDRYIRSNDDIIIMPLQCGTQWDALGHIVFEGKIYNGYDASFVTSAGALKLDVANASEGLVGRGVLLDVARHRGVDSLEPGFVIGGDELEATAQAQGVQVGQADYVLVRTGQMGEVRRRGAWADYAGGSAPGLGLGVAEWIHERELAGIATDTWGMEVLPNETVDVFQPLHIILIVHMGLWVGEIFDLEQLGTRCAELGRWEFLFSAPPLPFTRAVGSPVNPIAIL